MGYQSIEAEIAARRCAPDEVLRWVQPGMNIIVGAANGEPVGVIDALEAAARTAQRAAHEVCEQNRDVATASELETIIDETERRKWFLFEVVQGMNNTD